MYLWSMIISQDHKKQFFSTLVFYLFELRIVYVSGVSQALTCHLSLSLISLPVSIMDESKMTLWMNICIHTRVLVKKYPGVIPQRELKLLLHYNSMTDQLLAEVYCLLFKLYKGNPWLRKSRFTFKTQPMGNVEMV